MKQYQTPPKERSPVKTVRVDVLRHRDLTHVIPNIGTPEGAQTARRTYQEVYGGAR